ncbi:U32 family peptidase [Candidatus Methanomassiliicoccus intestinalis]|jgi:hypothetical protein CLOSPO_00499|uniref:Peptidase U32 n=1 Tax=Candidatus Methanomassiliicoccus intestinalis TaxID=1406512 RepID=A0A8J8TDL7_9ARCH|nr:MAG: hypothetical protein A3207_07915 [Candidatus Methanomassiliicoccus intestinalis]
MIEVLAPAGSKEAFSAALKAGADAVYLGGKTFGARSSAANFSDGELDFAVKTAHENNMKVYVTVNTLIKDSEMKEAFSFVSFLDSIGADAVIVQDRGLASLVKKELSIPLHASTQMGLHSKDDLLWAEKIGFERVILPRELSIGDINALRKETSIGLEVFVHGALCYAFSGQCLFSSAVGGRSGNRGMCAQPCRKQYTLGKETSFMLSTADLFCADSLPDLISAGVGSVKIEGRLRSPIYVYLATKLYKKAADRAARGEYPLYDERDAELLMTAFNRGFSEGYLKTDKVMQKSYADSRGLPLGKASVEGRTVSLNSERLKPGDGLTFYRGADKVGGFEVRSVDFKNGISKLTSPFRLEMGEYDVYKTKDREFNEIEKLISMDMRYTTAKRRWVDIPSKVANRRKKECKLSCYVSDIKSLKAVLPYSDRIYYDAPNAEEARDLCGDIEMVTVLPRVTPVIPDASGPVMVNSPGQAYHFIGHRMYGSYFMNFFNSYTIPDLYQYTASVELSREDLKDLTSHYKGKLEVMVFGRVEMMVTKDPSLREGNLVDGLGKRFPVVRDPYGWAHIMNSSDLFLLDFLDEIDTMGIDSYGLDLRYRQPELAAAVVKAFKQRDINAKDKLKKRCGSITAGHYLRGLKA